MFANFTKFISDLKSDCKAGYKAVVFGYDTATSATDEQIPQVARLLDLPLTAVKVGRTAALVIHSKYFKAVALTLTYLLPLLPCMLLLYVYQSGLILP